MGSKVKNIKVLLIKPLEDICKDVLLKTDSLSEIYSLLECNCIDIVTVEIGDRIYDIYCDDEFLLKNTATLKNLSFADGFNERFIFGNIFVAKSDSMGNLKGLTKDDIKHITKYISFNSETEHCYLNV